MRTWTWTLWFVVPTVFFLAGTYWDWLWSDLEEEF